MVLARGRPGSSSELGQASWALSPGRLEGKGMLGELWAASMAASPEASPSNAGCTELAGHG